MSKKRKNKPVDNVELNRRIRKSWGEIDPVTKIVPDKKKDKLEEARLKDTKDEY